MVEAAKKAGRIVQIGFQRRQSQALGQARDYLRNGTAGRIVQVEAQIFYTAGLKDTTPQNPPESLDWDLWCGPAPKLPYCPQIGHVAWRLEKETVFVTDNRWETIPRDKKAAKKVNEVRTDMAPLHMNNFLDCVRSRQQPLCPPEDAYSSTATVQLAMIAYQVGARIAWDTAGERIPDNPQATRLLKREYRQPWVHPYRA